MNNKKNYIKGIDRISVLLCIPIAIWGFFFTKSEYTYRKAVDIDNSDEIKKAAAETLYEKDREKAWWWQFRSIGNEGNSKGVIVSGKGELQKEAGKCPLSELQLKKTLELGADPDGDWIDKEEFGWKKGNIFDLLANPSCIIPGKIKRYSAGLIGFIGFYLLSFFVVVTLSRLTRYLSVILKKYFGWVRKGFSESR